MTIFSKKLRKHDVSIGKTKIQIFSLSALKVIWNLPNGAHQKCSDTEKYDKVDVKYTKYCTFFCPSTFLQETSEKLFLKIPIVK